MQVARASMLCTLIPVTDLKVGDRIAGLTVTALRTSKSGATIFITGERKDGTGYTFRQSSITRIARF